MHLSRRKKDAIRRVLPHTFVSFLVKRLRQVADFSRGWILRLKYKTDRNSPVVTILGSCRQDSLYRKFEVTAIRDGLTYPHYPNEVLQLIRYCKNQKETKFLSPFVFRNDCIGKKRISHNKAHKEFKRTDVFVIEIASLLEYKHKGDFIHHEAYDHPRPNKSIEENLSENVIQEISVDKQGFLEAEKALSEIIHALGRKKVVFVSNISSREFGGRAELNSLLKGFSEKNLCSYFDPTELLDHYSLEEICKTEPVISHFTELGHELVGHRLSGLIKANFLRETKSREYLVQKYQAFPRDHDIHGIGDFLYGCLKIFDVAKKKKLIPAVDFSAHPMANFLQVSHRSDEKVTTVFHSESDRPLEKGGTFFTNLRPEQKPSKEAIQFILSQVLSPNTRFNRLLCAKRKELNLEKNRYIVFHVRVGDDSFSSHRMDPVYVNKIVEFISKSIKNYPKGMNSIVISDSSELVNALKVEGIQTGSTGATHFGDSRGSIESIQETLVDFFLLLGAKKIVQLSNYSWGSSFSDIPSLLMNIPIEKYALSEI